MKNASPALRPLPEKPAGVTLLITHNNVLFLSIILLCLLWPGIGNAQEALWKTYMDAAGKAQENKNYDEAEKLYKLAETKAKEFGDTDERYVKTLVQQTKLYLIQKKKAEALERHQLIVALLEKGAGADSGSNANEVLQLGNMFAIPERMYKEAEPLLKYAVAIYRRVSKPNDPKLTNSLHHLGSSYYGQGKLKEAEETFKEELKLSENDPELSKQMAMAYTLGYLGFIMKDLKRYAEAEGYTGRALRLVNSLHGENHPFYAQMLQAQSFNLMNQEKYAEVETALKRAIEINENVYGKLSAATELPLDSLAFLYYRQSRLDEAISLSSRVLDILESLPNPRADQITLVTDRMFDIYRRQKKYAEGESICQRAARIFESKSLRNPETDLFVTECLAGMYISAGDYAAEAQTYRKFIESQEKLGPEGEARLADKLVALGNSYNRQRKYDDAVALFRRAEQIYARKSPEPNLGLLQGFGRYYYFIGNYKESENYFSKLVFQLSSGKNVPDKLLQAWYKKGYALTLYALGKTAQADEVFKGSIATLKTDKIDGERDIGASYHELATLFTAQGKFAEAEPLFKQAIEMRERALGANHPELAASLENYADLLKKAGRSTEAAGLEARAQAIRAKQPQR